MSGLGGALVAVAAVIVIVWLLGMVLSAIGFAIKVVITVAVLVVIAALVRAGMGEGRDRR